MKKLLTVVIPTYNMEAYLDHCLTSLIIHDDALMKQLEVLVVIDGARDRSSEIAHHYAKRYPETIRVIDKENGNYGSCVNRGLREARGKYIKILDADDSFDTLHFTSYLNQLQHVDADVIVNDHCIVDMNGDVVMTKEENLRKNALLAVDEAIPYFTAIQIGMHSLAYRTQMLIDHNYCQTEGVSYTDQQWVLFPIVYADKYYYIKECIYRYLIGREGQTVAGDTMIRNCSHHIKRVVNCVKEYAATEITSQLKLDYVHTKLLGGCHRIYSSYLYYGKDFLAFDDLLVFDQTIKTISPSFYNRLDRLTVDKYLPFRYVAYWKRHGAGKPSRLIVLMFSLCQNIRNIIRR